MRIKKLNLRNGFKRFFNVTIDLGDNPARIIALVGPNGIGKSSVLDGLMFYQNAYDRVGEYFSTSGDYHSMFVDRPVSYQDVTIDFVEDGFHKIREKKKALGKENTIFSFRSPYRYNNEVLIKEVRATQPIKENDYGAGSAAAIDSKMENNYRRLHSKINKYMQENDTPPSVARNVIIGELNKSIKSCLDLEISSSGNVEAGEGTLYFKKNDHLKEFSFNVLSSGEKEVVDLLLDLYLRKEDYDETIFLIDEPELHINTSIQAKLLCEIDKLVGENCQIWLTTHSIGFLRALQNQMADKCQVIQFKSDMKLASSSYILEPMKRSAAAWRELFSVALDDLTELVSPKRIIYCEGRDTPGKGGVERGLDAKVFNNIFAEKYPDTTFVSSGGNTELDQRSAVAVALLSKVFPSLEILVFKDKDMASGKEVSESQRRIYLDNNPVSHRVMKRYEIENYLFDKDVLKDYCKNNGLEFNDSAYDELVVDVVNQDLKSITVRIKNISGIVGNINPEVFKLNLSNHLKEGMPVFEELRACIFDRA